MRILEIAEEKSERLDFVQAIAQGLMDIEDGNILSMDQVIIRLRLSQPGNFRDNCRNTWGQHGE